MIDMFGFPVFKKSLSEEKFNKEDLIKTIENNYETSKNRNEWDKKFSDIHHSLEDDNNKLFNEPDYSSILPVYENSIREFLLQLKLKNSVNFNWEIVNYTCMTEGQYMKDHMHLDCDFTGIHYLQYDDNKNNSTWFKNTSSHSEFVNVLRPKFVENFDEYDTRNSWMFSNFKLNIKEDDLIIFPALLTHSISKVKTNKKRITIIFNFDIVKNEN